MRSNLFVASHHTPNPSTHPWLSNVKVRMKFNPENLFGRTKFFKGCFILNFGYDLKNQVMAQRMRSWCKERGHGFKDSGHGFEVATKNI